MIKRKISTAKAPSPAGPYSQAIVVEGERTGKMIFVAGTVALDPETKKISGQTIEEQTEQALRNVGAILAEAGASPTDVVKTTVHLDDINRIAGFNTVYEKFFPEPRPVRTTVASQMGPGIMVEIDVIAVK